MRLYLAGPMQGYPDHNYPAFFAEAARLRALGYLVENPAEINHDFATVGRAVCMRRDLRALMRCDMVALLPGAFMSAGAQCETAVAEQCGIPVKHAANLKKPVAPHVDEPEEAESYRLHAPARVGGGTFGVGTPWRVVIERAQAHHSELLAVGVDTGEFKALGDKVAADALDAARYRWLRSVPTVVQAKRIVNDTPEGIDRAIDAERTKAPR